MSRLAAERAERQYDARGARYVSGPAFRELLAYCRAGFEAECAGELAAAGTACGMRGEADAPAGSARVILRLGAAARADALDAAFRLRELVFARQIVFVAAHVERMPAGDRVVPLLQAAAAAGPPFSALWLETADTNEAKQLSGLCRGLAPLLEQELAAQHLLAPGRPDRPRLHVFLISGTEALVGISLPGSGSDWPMGIPRLRLPREAPSRSTLKLAEALFTLLTERERETWLKPGMRVIDLGAAPGGWSWQMASRGLRVTAVDNGRIAPPVMETGLVEHLRADGFTFRPRGRVDWLLCDMVAQPSRIAALVGEWAGAGRCRQAIFNLKLPMKKRLEELERCRALILRPLAGRPADLRLKQLYHDREEVTGFLRPG
jgi:23S rRNA (cytidine2498-2'-O)-methyltransferase